MLPFCMCIMIFLQSVFIPRYLTIVADGAHTCTRHEARVSPGAALPCHSEKSVRCKQEKTVSLEGKSAPACQSANCIRTFSQASPNVSVVPSRIAWMSRVSGSLIVRLFFSFYLFFFRFLSECEPQLLSGERIHHFGTVGFTAVFSLLQRDQSCLVHR